VSSPSQKLVPKYRNALTIILSFCILNSNLKSRSTKKGGNTVVAKINHFLTIARDGEHTAIFPNEIQWQNLSCVFNGVFVILI